MIDHDVKDRGRVGLSRWSREMTVPREIVRLQLAALRVAIDDLTPRREPYLASWRRGT
jgi:hypothetical protein